MLKWGLLVGSSVYNSELDLSAIGYVANLSCEVGVEENDLGGWGWFQGRDFAGLAKDKRWNGKQELT